ncbi:hypothetical protein XENTR_v10022630 [Xenopus tropicalis]|uniref:Uncharacterized protein LOC116406897 n=1 Tax=Xenopus tropicalis TaxID=8364 RepID=A0A8J1IQF0_XENTR|nr:uncharacterized protein LOC116406897 [Xenopus tropicalis]KAE8588599.1 hypothetical protein XENTR_v10022630 [Xenopus tropicalis]
MPFAIHSLALLCLWMVHIAASKTEWRARSSTLELCGLTCEGSGFNTLERDSAILEIDCKYKSLKIFNGYYSRTHVNISTGCCSIQNLSKSDTGAYNIFNIESEKKLVQSTYYVVIDPVQIRSLSSSRSDGGREVRVTYTGDEATVIWTWNGGALPMGHRLSDGNKTLTVPSNYTGTFRVYIRNPINETSAEINIPLPESPSRSVQARAGTIGGAVILDLIVLVSCWVWACRKSRAESALQLNGSQLRALQLPQPCAPGQGGTGTRHLDS